MVNDENNLDNEVSALFNNAKEKIKVVENNSVHQKKQIIIELAKSLEGRIVTNTICIEIKHQLRGVGVSDRHIEECLEEKYKQAHRVRNASKRNRSKSESIQLMENLAAIPRLNQQEDDLMEIDEEEDKISMNKEQLENIVETSNGQILILNDTERDQSIDSDLSKKPSAKANTEVQLKENLLDELSTKTSHQGEETEGYQSSVPSNISTRSISCSQCVKKDVQNRVLKSINFELAEVIKEFDQLKTADKLPKSSQDNNEESKDSLTNKLDIAEFEDYKSFKEVSEYVKPFFKLGNNARIPFSIKIDMAKRKLISLRLGAGSKNE